jgi:hypothetical protein
MVIVLFEIHNKYNQLIIIQKNISWALNGEETHCNALCIGVISFHARLHKDCNC